MAESNRLPIKVVLPRPQDIQAPEGTHGRRKVFDEETLDASRSRLSGEALSLGEYFKDSFTQNPNVPAVGRVSIKKDALAKTHRPERLLRKSSCLIIGAGQLGDLFISLRPSTINQLATTLLQDRTQDGIADISTIETIRPYTASDSLGSFDVSSLHRTLSEANSPLKVKIFTHKNPSADNEILQTFKSQIEGMGLPQPEEVYYSRGAKIFRLAPPNPQSLERIVRFVGVQSVSIFPQYYVLRTASRPVRGLTSADLPPPEPGRHYPVVGLIDSGTDPSNQCLNPWIIKRIEKVQPFERDYGHGTFVAGIIVHSRSLNNNDPRFPDTSAYIIDVVAVPKDGISEDELITILETVIPECPEARVWNLSLATDDPCTDSAFSDLSVALDRIQDQYGVTFIQAAGNFRHPNLRTWPPNNMGQADRICAPADSPRSIVVGSVAHLDNANTCVKTGEPSPFTRRGPGPSFLPKPDVSHHGGNCSADGNYAQTGILSTIGEGLLAEDIGTSESTPCITSLYANILEAPQPLSRFLAKALLIHSAALNSGPVDSEELRYRGFGIPGDSMQVLTCTPWSATLIFEADLPPGKVFEKWPFPIPPCLRGKNGAVKGEFIMTLVHDPPLDSTYGAEYCRRNVDASLGTYDLDGSGKRCHRGQVPPEPKNLSQKYEKYLVEHGFKWSPVKSYRRMAPRGIKGNDWRLTMTVQNRRELTDPEPQPIALVVTIFDPKQEKRTVYDEVVRAMAINGWTTVNLQVREEIQQKIS